MKENISLNNVVRNSILRVKSFSDYSPSSIKVFQNKPADLYFWEHYFPDKQRSPKLGAKLSQALGSPKKRLAVIGGSIGVILATVLAWSFGAKVAAAVGAGAAQAGEKMHLGPKVANYLRSKGMTNELIVIAVSALPAVELRGGIPVGIWLGLPVLKTFLLSVFGNMLPIVILLALLKSARFQKLMSPLIQRAKSKTEGFGEKNKEIALALFVGIPFPGTGAWTGAFIALLLDMGFRASVLVNLIGVLIAGGIMTTVSVLGREAAIRTGLAAVHLVKSHMLV